MSASALVLPASVPLIGAASIVLYIVLRYVPLIEKIAFEIPRHQAPARFEHPDTLDAREFEIPIEGGGTVDAQYIASQRAENGLVVFCHETGADGNSWVKHAAFLTREGFDVLTFHFDSRDENYQWPSEHEYAHLRAVLNWVARERKGFETALFGVSKGSLHVVRAASEFPNIRAVIVDGLFSTRLTLQAYMNKWAGIYIWKEAEIPFIPQWIYALLAVLVVWFAGWKRKMSFFSSEQYLEKLKTQVLLIHAEKDSFARLKDLETLRRLIPGKSELWIVPGARHSESVFVQPEQYRNRILGFLRKAPVVVSPAADRL